MYNIVTADAASKSNQYKQSTFEGNDSSLAGYKLTIYTKINKIINKALNNRDMIFTVLSEECFRNMKQNPAYETWVLNKIRSVCEACKEDGYDNRLFLEFGATEADYKENSYSMSDSKKAERERERELEAKKELKRKRKKQLEKKLLEEKLRKRDVERTYVWLKSLDHRMQVQEENRAIYFAREYFPKDHSATLYAAAKRRASAYESTFVYRN